MNARLDMELEENQGKRNRIREQIKLKNINMQTDTRQITKNKSRVKGTRKYSHFHSLRVRQNRDAKMSPETHPPMMSW